METGGDSLATGIRNLIEDIGKGRISMTDEQGVRGRPQHGDNARLRRLRERADPADPVPAAHGDGGRAAAGLVSAQPSTSSTCSICSRANSFVRYAVEQGNTVFMVSWRNIMVEQGHLTWDDYLTELGIMRAIDVALAKSRVRTKPTRWVSASAARCSAARLPCWRRAEEDKIESLTFLTTMLDFTTAGEIGLLIDEQSVAAREQTIGGGGVFPGRELAFVFSTLRGNDLIWPYVVGNYLEGRQPDAFDILYWNADSTNLPGPMYCWYVRNTYLENNIRNPGKTTQCGVTVDLMQIDVPTYVLACREDHIVPWQTAYRPRNWLIRATSGSCSRASGHIAGVINPASRNKRSFWIDGELGKPERWLETAREVPGSWWTDWSAWLRTHAGEQVPHRHVSGTRDFPKSSRPRAATSRRAPTEALTVESCMTRPGRRNMTDIVIASAARTPVGSFNGAFANTACTRTWRGCDQGRPPTRKARTARSGRSHPWPGAYRRPRARTQLVRPP